MKTLESVALRYGKDGLYILDQQLLPAEEKWLKCNSPDDMITMIQALKVRGAPLIGVAAAVSLADYAKQGVSVTEFEQAARRLREARPTAVNLAFCVDRILEAITSATSAKKDLSSVVSSIAEDLFEEDVAMCQKMGEYGAAVVQPKEGVLTYCNAGSLATVGIGTALGVIKTAHQQGKTIHVFPCETRPLLQGARLTAWELKQDQIPHTLICDNMVAYSMAQGKIQRIFVGADRIAKNGDFANKIGTYSVAVLAQHHQIPFYVVAPYTTIDFQCKSGKDIIIEERAASEVRGASGSFGSVTWAPAGVNTYNPSFDVTPNELVTGYVLDSGLVLQKDLAASGLKKA